MHGAFVVDNWLVIAASSANFGINDITTFNIRKGMSKCEVASYVATQDGNLPSYVVPITEDETREFEAANSLMKATIYQWRNVKWIFLSPNQK